MIPHKNVLYIRVWESQFNVMPSPRRENIAVKKGVKSLPVMALECQRERHRRKGREDNINNINR